MQVGGAPAQTTITGAVTAQVGIIGTLQSAGARYILVPTIPDIGNLVGPLNPWQSVGVAAGVAFLLGLLVSRR